MKDEENVRATVESDTQLVGLIMSVAQFQARTRVTGDSGGQVCYLNPQDVRDAADLVFLAMEFVEDRKKR